MDAVTSCATHLHAAWYAAPIPVFLRRSRDEVLGALTAASRFSVDLGQREAWTEELAVLRNALAGLEGWLYLEFDVPRLGSRIDAVVVAGSAVIPIEFKVGEGEYRRSPGQTFRSPQLPRVHLLGVGTLQRLPASPEECPHIITGRGCDWAGRLALKQRGQGGEGVDIHNLPESRVVRLARSA